MVTCSRGLLRCTLGAMENLETTSTPARKLTRLTAADIHPKAPNPREHLSRKQMVFVLEYLKDFNGQQAAIRSGYSAKASAAIASRMIKDGNVCKYITDVMTVRMQKLDKDSDALMRELARLAHVDLGKAFLPDGSFLPLAEMHEDVRRCIAGIETEETWETRYEDGSGKAEDELEPVLVRTVIRKIKFWDKNKAADTLAKCMKLFSNGAQVNVNLSLETLVLNSIPTASKPPSTTIEHQAAPALADASAPEHGVGSRAGLAESPAEQP